MSDKQIKSYDYNVAFMKLFFSFCVVLAHYWKAPDDSLYHISFMYRIISIAAPVFFLISFYLTSDTIRTSDVKRIGKRLWRLIFPFVSWGVIYYLVYILIGFLLGVIKTIDNSFVIRFTKKDLMWQILLGSDRYLCPPLWFQFVLIVFTVLFWLIYKMFPKRARIVLIILGIWAIVMQYTMINYNLFCRFEFELWWPLGRLAESIPYAVIGACLLNKDLIGKLRNNWLITLIIGIIVMILTGPVKIIPTPEYGFSYHGINLILYTISVFILLNLIPFHKANHVIKRVIRLFSKYSFGVFCIHYGVGHILDHLVLEALGWKTDTFTECVFIYFISLLTSWLIAKIPGKLAKQLVM